MKKKRKIPKFKDEDEERAFWSEHDSTDYVDWSSARRVTLPNLKPSTRSISIRLPEILLEELKVLANKRDVPYQSLLKVFLAERVDAEYARMRRSSGEDGKARDNE
jgi:predicted DNA binding CopG/RHH family protein